MEKKIKMAKTRKSSKTGKTEKAYKADNNSKKRVVRNKARDVIGDYWKVNREIGKSDREATKDSKGQPFRSNEKIYIAIIIIGTILIIFKYAYLK